MEISLINIKIDNLCKMVSNHQLNDFFTEINRTIGENKNLLFLKDKIRRQIEIYSNLLNYSFTDIKDPERDNIYSKILYNIYGIIDELKFVLIDENKFWATNTLKQVTKYEFQTNREIIEKTILEGSYTIESDKLFNQIWLSSVLLDNDTLLLNKILKSNKVSWIDEALAVSALTISAINHFDEKKLSLIFDF